MKVFLFLLWTAWARTRMGIAARSLPVHVYRSTYIYPHLLVYSTRHMRRHLHAFVYACVRCKWQGADGNPQGGLAPEVKIVLNIIIGQH